MGEDTFRVLFDASSDALFVHDEVGRIVLVNQGACTMLRCTVAQALASSVGDLSSNEPGYTQEVAAERVQLALREGGALFDWRSRRLDGELFWSEVSLRPVTLQGRQHVLACVREIEHRKRMEEALRASEARFAKIFNSTSYLLAFTDPVAGRIIDVNESWLRTTGLTRQEALGKTGIELELWANPSERAAIRAEVERNGRAHEVEALLNLGGRKVPCLMSVEQVYLNGNRFFLFEVHDISVRKQAEREQEALRGQLLQSQKMESVGLLAGGIAHDFNNLLTVINGATSLLREHLPAAHPDREHLDDIHQAGQRAAALTQQLLAFSRRQVLQPRVIDLNDVVGETELLLRRLIGEDVVLDVQLTRPLGLVRADPSQLGQVIMNLAVNARDAMPRGGRLTIRTAEIQVPSPPADPTRTLAPGPYVLLSVTDTGVGMSDETQRRLFEPFFTTKARGTGTGLGLSTAYGLVQQSGGWISVKSQVGEGSTFDIHLPRVESSPPRAPSRPPSLEKGTETLLVVEDQDDVRRFVVRALTRLGYQVIEAASGQAALAQAAAFGGEIHLLLTDVIMPELSGPKLRERLQALRPGLPVLFMSGYTDNVLELHGVPGNAVEMIQKPFSPQALALKIREVLAAAARVR